MKRNQYFYLIAGLPDLAITDTQLPVTARDFLAGLETTLSPVDLDLVRWLYYARDNRNLIDMLVHEKTILYEGYYSLQELEKGVKGSLSLPGYMTRFIEAFNEGKGRYTAAEWESRLTEGYFAAGKRTGNTFLEQWIDFEVNLKNLLLVLSNRKRQLPGKAFIIEGNEMASLFNGDEIADFSTEPALDFAGEAAKVLEKDNLMERERKIDLLRWKKIEGMAFFHYFTIERVLCFVVQLMIVERWMTLHKKHEKKYLPFILRSLMEKQDFYNQTIEKLWEPGK